ncbi:hypothetical protein T552_01999 [Pneumocystis carinii B80]|uniref:Aminotransferase class IV n=1 Tax=Pneumocystis carinii (strain B80) TaxID=1408658 RepID=A0A0W4ZIE0_PNEC8|nr:hypothetical protein T552_01999 [Pneumocystis carinii B80]KTW28140.1 hypothetical protein T552_01999 [Pneumocystis carinii B80]
MNETRKLKDITQGKEWDLLETILYDGSNFFLLEKHLQRLIKASIYFEWKTIDIKRIEQKLWDSVRHLGSSKVRLTVDQNGIIDIQVSPFILSGNLFGIFSKNDWKEEKPWRVYLDTIPMDDKLRPFFCHKTTYRDPYEAARKRLKIHEEMEVLLYNQYGYVMEGSICNVAFFRNYQWITPTLKEGCLPGVMRETLLEKKYIIEHSIKINDLINGERLLLFNSLRGCFQGILYIS